MHPSEELVEGVVALWAGIRRSAHPTVEGCLQVVTVSKGESDGVGDVSAGILSFLGRGDEDFFQIIQIVVSREERAVCLAEIERIEIFRIGSCKFLGYLLLRIIEPAAMSSSFRIHKKTSYYEKSYLCNRKENHMI